MEAHRQWVSEHLTQLREAARAPVQEEVWVWSTIALARHRNVEACFYAYLCFAWDAMLLVVSSC